MSCDLSKEIWFLWEWGWRAPQRRGDYRKFWCHLLIVSSHILGTNLYIDILEQVAVPFSRESFQPGDRTWVFCTASRFFTIWATRGAPHIDIFVCLFRRSVVSDSLWPHGLQHARLPCPPPTPRACSNSCPSSQWCHSTISSCRPLLLLPSTFPAIRFFSNESVLCIYLLVKKRVTLLKFLSFDNDLYLVDQELYS